MTYHGRADETTEWLNYLQPEGLVVGANVLREKELSPVRQTPLDTDEAREALGLPADASREDDRHFVLSDVWPFFERVLNWPSKLVAGSPGPQVSADLSRTVPEHETLLSPDMAILWNGVAEDGVPAQALVLLHPTLDCDGRNQFGPSEWEASPHQRLERLLRETGVGVGILVARNTLRLVHAPKGETTGWISWPLAALGRVEGRPMLAGLKLCLGRNAFFTGAPETRLRRLLKASRESQNEVSEKLSGQVLGALYELLRGLHRAAPDRIETIADEDPHHLYEGLLTCLMRLVFLLYAEDRDLLPSSNDAQLRQLWESGYSIKTLYARLLVDEALNPDTMDERHGGWGQLLAVFRLIHDGYGDWVARRGGKLFDPNVFPFLEGRDKGSAREDGEVLPVSDGTILRMLHGLMTVDGRSLSGEKIRERLSYRSLDVESIGSVYETVMGFTAKRATERMVALRDEKKLPAFVGLESLLAHKPADRQKWLKDQSIKLSVKQAKGVKEAKDVPALLEAFGGAIDLRASPDSTPIGTGAPYMQPTEERRRSGSHYTPRSLTEPIVRHALEPAFERIGTNASSEAVLALKVLDPACGSGAFLVEACRQIGARLEQAWDMHKAEKPTIPPDEDEATHARRLVAQRCLYGVDRNPMAVDLARLSLWLATLAREHEFSFLDHALKSGDSLVGLTQREIAAANWDTSKPGLPLFRQTVKESVDKALLGREAIRQASDDVLMEAQAARYSHVLDASEPARIVGDAVIAAFFEGDKAKGRETARVEVERWIADSIPPKWNFLKAKAQAFHAKHAWRPFHWEVEFPEVFARDNPGFDAIVGNPPFLGGNSISPLQGVPYLWWLQTARPDVDGNSDLVAYFFRRAFDIVNGTGSIGFISTNTIRQGDTRRAALKYIVQNGGKISHALTRFVWPGSASVIVSIVNVTKAATDEFNLNGRLVDNISSFLLPNDVDDDPHLLGTNAGLSFRGVSIVGNGFILEAGEARELLGATPANHDVLLPFMGGRELNSNPHTRYERYVINFGTRTLTESERWPSLLEIARQRVKPERDKREGNAIALRQKKYWWRFRSDTPLLRAAISKMRRCICCSEVSNNLQFAFQSSDQVFSNTLHVFAFDSASTFAVLQSRVHEVWARYLGSSMKDDLRYILSSCFETYPLPPSHDSDEALELAGQTYHDHRAELMIAVNEGMTRIHNRFHKPEERSPAILRLRELHDAMDRAVLHAYGWDDLAETLRPELLTEETEDDHTYQGRYFWPADQRDLVLSRLLALNAERHAEEVAVGRVVPASSPRGIADDAEDDGQDSLDLE